MPPSCSSVSSSRARNAATVAILLALLASRPAGAATPPRLVIQAPDNLVAYKTRLDTFDAARLLPVMRLTGLDDPGPPIRIVLAAEDSPLAGRQPPWAAGYAVGDFGLVVLFPTRTPSFPYETLEEVLQHEVTHVLIARAAGRRRVPRWFHEGLAVVAERAPGLGDQVRLLAEVTFGPRVSLAELDRLFAGDIRAARRAYTLATGFVRDLLEANGSEFAARILALVARGQRFEGAFVLTVGVAPEAAAEAFWRRETRWTRWVPVAVSPYGLMLVMTLLAIYAIVVQQRRRAVRRRQWAEDDQGMTADDPPEAIH